MCCKPIDPMWPYNSMRRQLHHFKFEFIVLLIKTILVVVTFQIRFYALIEKQFSWPSFFTHNSKTFQEFHNVTNLLNILNTSCSSCFLLENKYMWNIDLWLWKCMWRVQKMMLFWGIWLLFVMLNPFWGSLVSTSYSNACMH